MNRARVLYNIKRGKMRSKNRKGFQIQFSFWKNTFEGTGKADVTKGRCAKCDWFDEWVHGESPHPGTPEDSIT